MFFVHFVNSNWILAWLATALFKVTMVLMNPGLFSSHSNHTVRMDPTLQNGWVQAIADEVERRVAERLQSARLTDPAEQDGGEDNWVLAAESREAGEFDIPETLKSVCTRHPVEAIYSKQSIAKFLSRHPEPRGGHLKAPLIDSQLQASFDSRKKDEPWFEVQRAVLCSIRPLISIHERIHSMAEEGPERDEVLECIRDTIRYVRHISGIIQVNRRTSVAALTGLLPRSESHHTAGSSEEGQLFGPELRGLLEAEKKSIRPKGKPLPPSNNYGFEGKGGRPRNPRGSLRWRPPRSSQYSGNH